MGRSLLTVLGILMLGMLISVVYFSSTRAEAVTPTPDASSILNASGEALGATCNAAEAYTFVKSRVSGSANIQPQLSGGGDGAQGGIDPELACRLQRFLQAYPHIRVISGHRSSSYQRALCRRKCGADSCPGRCAPPGRSCHQYGLAVDVTDNSAAMREAAKRFKLHYPYSKAHIQCIEHKTAGRSTCTGPCAKGGIQINDGDTASTLPGSQNNPYNPGNSPFSSSPGGVPDPSSLLSNLGGSPGGTSPGSTSNSSAIYTSLPELQAAVWESGDIDGQEFIGDGPPAFDELLGEFGEFGEGEEVREVLGYNSSSTNPNTVERFDSPVVNIGFISTTTPAISSSSNECTDGVVTKNIYGNIICVRNSVTTTIEESTIEQNSEAGEEISFLESISSGGPVKNTLSTLVGSIIPLRHLSGDDTGNDSQQSGYIYDVDRTSTGYDAYQPIESTAYGDNPQTPLQEEDIIAWMIQADLVEEEDVAAQATLSTLMGMLRPALMHLALVLFGTGSYGAEALLELANNIQQ